MKHRKHIQIVIAIGMAGAAQAAVTQVGTLALVNNIGGTIVRYDSNTGTLGTKNAGGPVNISSSFIGYSQQMGGGSPDADDLGLRTFSASTLIHNLSKTNSSSLAGAVQWTFDLTPLDSYLASNSLTATTLNLQMVLSQNNTAGTYDSYLSYTNATEGITLTALPATATGIHSDFYAPGNAATAGDVVNGDFKLIAKGLGGNNYNATTVIPLLDLYGSGVRQFNLILASAVSSGATNQITISDTSGIYFDAIPEPSATLLGGLGLLALLRRRR